MSFLPFTPVLAWLIWRHRHLFREEWLVLRLRIALWWDDADLFTPVLGDRERAE